MNYRSAAEEEVYKGTNTTLTNITYTISLLLSSSSTTYYYYYAMRLAIMNEPLWKHFDSPILSSAYWMSQGIDTHTSVALETFQCQLLDRKFLNSSVIYIENRRYQTLSYLIKIY